LAYANGFTLWHYRTADEAGELFAAGYFNPAARMVRAGDFVMVNAQIASAEPINGTLVVAANVGGEVSVTKAGF
jgi:hypothetical protein